MKRTENRLAEQLRLFLSALASIAYLGGGIGLIASSQSFGIPVLAGPLRYALAALMLAYGSFRAYRAWQDFSSQ
jgi:hypothetical protein